ncbi:restriction endonuclease subunit S, partial [Desulfofundulus sp.]|uniref:restriction endonuclease subunit S n=1 Tax=Desulfofundulus sp. TaxID=2282750 RepID=UPI003C77AFB0
MGKAIDEVMEGYKETEIGVLPEDWEVVRVGHVTIESYSGGTPSTKESAYWGGSIPWTTTALMGEEEIYLTTYQRLITERALNETSTRLAPKGSLLLGTRVGVGKAVIATFDIAVNQDITVLRLDTQKILPQFLAYGFKTDLVRESLRGKVRGTTIKGIPRNDLLTLCIPLPPLPEQRKIAHVLSTIQRAIEMQDRVIAAARELKKSLMRHLFTYGPMPVDQIDRVPLKETEIGPVPEHWEVVRLGEAITQAQYGLSMRGESTGKYPILR